jgi:hypothetical protein
MTYLDLMIYASALLTLFFLAPKSFAQQTSAGSV